MHPYFQPKFQVLSWTARMAQWLHLLSRGGLFHAFKLNRHNDMSSYFQLDMHQVVSLRKIHFIPSLEQKN